MSTKQQRITYHYHFKGLNKTYHPTIGKDGELVLSVLTPDNIYNQYPLYEGVEDENVSKMCSMLQNLSEKEDVGVIAIKYDVNYLADPGKKLIKKMHWVVD